MPVKCSGDLCLVDFIGGNRTYSHDTTCWHCTRRQSWGHFPSFFRESMVLRGSEDLKMSYHSFLLHRFDISNTSDNAGLLDMQTIHMFTVWLLSAKWRIRGARGLGHVMACVTQNAPGIQNEQFKCESELLKTYQSCLFVEMIAIRDIFYWYGSEIA